MSQVASEHPDFDACIFKVLDALSNIILELILDSGATKYIQVFFTQVSKVLFVCSVIPIVRCELLFRHFTHSKAQRSQSAAAIAIDLFLDTSLEGTRLRLRCQSRHDLALSTLGKHVDLAIDLVSYHHGHSLALRGELIHIDHVKDKLFALAYTNAQCLGRARNELTRSRVLLGLKKGLLVKAGSGENTLLLFGVFVWL